MMVRICSRAHKVSTPKQSGDWLIFRGGAMACAPRLGNKGSVHVPPDETVLLQPNTTVVDASVG